MINKAVLVGRIATDINARMTPTGKKVVTFRLAVSRNKKQEGQPEADFINIVAWEKRADIVEQYTNKGQLIGVAGRIQTRSYDGQTGRVYVTEIVADEIQLLEKSLEKKEDQPMLQNAYQQPYQTQSPGINYDEDIPF